MGDALFVGQSSEGPVAPRREHFQKPKRGRVNVTNLALPIEKEHAFAQLRQNGLQTVVLTFDDEKLLNLAIAHAVEGPRQKGDFVPARDFDSLGKIPF